MKKKLMAILLSLAMVSSTAPQAVTFAADLAVEETENETIVSDEDADQFEVVSDDALPAEDSLTGSEDIEIEESAEEETVIDDTAGSAEEEVLSDDLYYYRKISDTEVAVTGIVSEDAEELTIPSELILEDAVYAVTAVEKDAFDGLSAEKIIIPAGLTSFGAQALPELKTIEVSEDNTVFTVKDGVLFTKADEGEKADLLLYPAAADAESYIIPENTDPVSPVSTFREKPDTETAREYIAQGALWNGGVFAYKLGYVMRKAHELIDFSDYQDLFNRYEDLNKISFDYAVVEKEESIAVMRFAGEWKDLGTWNTLTESMTENTVGSVILADDCENVHVINELDIPVIGMGLKDVVVAASPDGILVSDKEQSGYLKKYVERLDEQVRYAEKSWGEYRVLDIGDSYETVKITVLAGHRMSYHSHQHRDEMWTVISGKGRTIVDGMEQNVEAGDVITMQAGCRHTVIAETDLNIIEVQIGREISAHDKQKYELER